jgi:uncharacterized protein YcaQ
MVRPRLELSSQEARGVVLAAQGLGRPRRTSRVDRRRLRAVIDAVGVIQLDAINVLERTQFLVPFSRVGPYDVGRLHAMTGPGGELFEYWGHAASLLPTVQQPLFRWRMAQHGPSGDSPTYAVRREAWLAANADYVAAVLGEVRDRGPLSASQLTDPRRRDGQWWERRSLGRRALEWMFARGELAAWRTPSFERVYDLPERVLPEAVLSQPTPPVEEAHRRLLVLAVRSLGVATLGDLAGYYVLKTRAARPRLAELVEAGELVRVRVEGWPEPGYTTPDARSARLSRGHATLLSPFDSLIWDRDRTRRLFGFDYRIEVYVPEKDRQHGYYVLPLLLGDQLVGRLDLKADRKASALRVQAAHIEPDADAGTVAAAAATELDSLRSWLHLDDVVVARRGGLARALRGSVQAVRSSV